jgi:hypothetical protein
MDSKIPTSFIPKDTIRTDLRTRREPVGILSIIALVILAGSLVYLAGIYVYRSTVYNEINSPCTNTGGGAGSCGLRASLTVETQDFERSKLEDLKRLDTKLKNGASVLNNHIAMRPLFNLLSTVTGQNIQYKKFDFNDTGLSIGGVAKSYEDIAFQQKVFATDPGAKKLIRNFSFSDFNLDPKGQVSFNLTLVVDPSLLSYSQNSQSQ